MEEQVHGGGAKTSEYQTEIAEEVASAEVTEAASENEKNEVPEKVAKEERESKREKFFTTKSITVAAMLTAISIILYMFVKFPLPFMFPTWLEMQFSDMPALIGSFMLGPVWGCIIIVLKCVIKGLIWSQTVGIGELADIIVGVAFVLPASLLYMKNRTKKGAIIGLGVGSACAVVASLLSNAFILMPMYMKAFGWEDGLKPMIVKLFPNITAKNILLYYLPLSVLPFNILRCLVCALITFFLYKHLQKLINRMFAPRKRKIAKEKPQETDTDKETVEHEEK